ncbi:hypothetical protein AXA44_07485 [Rhodococcus sp. SC4]|nr:hypothetical protein AXA44_07485 [Rhodococcus sp. SC4]KXX57401.1 hypothetical protein AZG88_11365 [Rhodococcus sp. LB1]
MFSAATPQEFSDTKTSNDPVGLASRKFEPPETVRSDQTACPELENLREWVRTDVAPLSVQLHAAWNPDHYAAATLRETAGKESRFSPRSNSALHHPRDGISTKYEGRKMSRDR